MFTHISHALTQHHSGAVGLVTHGHFDMDSTEPRLEPGTFWLLILYHWSTAAASTFPSNMFHICLVAALTLHVTGNDRVHDVSSALPCGRTCSRLVFLHRCLGALQTRRRRPVICSLSHTTPLMCVQRGSLSWETHGQRMARRAGRLSIFQGPFGFSDMNLSLWRDRIIQTTGTEGGCDDTNIFVSNVKPLSFL